MTAVYSILLFILFLVLLPHLVALRLRTMILHYPRSADYQKTVEKGKRYLLVELPSSFQNPLAVLLPGAGSRSRSSMAQAADFYRQRGFDIAWVDYPDTAYREGPLGWGLPEAKELVAKLVGIRVPIIVHGKSFGAAVALIAHALSPREWTTVSESAYANLTEVLEHRVLRPKWLPRSILNILKLGIKIAESSLKGWRIDVAASAPLKYLRPKRGAMIFLHGTNDRLVPPKHSILLHKQASWQGITTELVLIEGGRHSDLRASDIARWESSLEWAVSQACGKSN